jgi:hypothetical protein
MCFAHGGLGLMSVSEAITTFSPRMVFRHAYSYGLDDERVVYLLRKTIKVQPQILNDVTEFRSIISQIAPPE